MNSQMNIQTKLKLFKVYIKPLLTYGCELLDLDANEINELKKCEGNAIKQIVGISKKCHTTPLYGALDMGSTVNSILIQQMKFIKRIQSNEYLNEFLEESRNIKNNGGLIGRMIENNKWDPNLNVDKLNAWIEDKIKELSNNRMDTYNSNLEVIEIRKVLNLKNHYLKIFTLNCMLHSTTYATTAESQVSEALNNLNNLTTPHT
jgi:hypothetical protein